jgi:hypothetical protein
VKLPNVGTMLKAIFGAATAALGSLGAALVQAHTFSAIDDATWITIATATVLAFGAVYGVTNSPAAGGSSGST